MKNEKLYCCKLKGALSWKKACVQEDLQWCLSEFLMIGRVMYSKANYFLHDERNTKGTNVIVNKGEWYILFYIIEICSIFYFGFWEKFQVCIFYTLSSMEICFIIHYSPFGCASWQFEVDLKIILLTWDIKKSSIRLLRTRL